jgi:FkbM family methyltransferase
MSIKKLLHKIVKTRADGEIPIDTISDYLPEAPVIIEAGAHIGVDTLKLNQRWPKAKIYAFEPVPDIFKQLKAKTKSVKNIFCYPFAVGQKETTMQIYVSSGESDGSSSLLKPKEHLSLHPEVAFEKTTRVKVTTIDKWAQQNSITQVDFLWLDLQGYELAALKGAAEMLQSVKAIHTEVNLVEVYRGAPLYGELKQWLEKKGFKVVFEAIDWADGGNVLFARS